MRNGSSSMIGNIANRMVSSLAAQIDAEIKRAITHHLGSDEWTLDSIKDRCEMVVLKDDEREVFCMDGVELLEMYPIEHKATRAGDSETLTASRNVRRLWLTQ